MHQGGAVDSGSSFNRDPKRGCRERHCHPCRVFRQPRGGERVWTHTTLCDAMETRSLLARAELGCCAGGAVLGCLWQGPHQRFGGRGGRDEQIAARNQRSDKGDW